MATISKYQTASGATLYRVRYRTPGRGQTDKRGFRTKRDAEAFANTVEVTKARGEYVAPSLGRVTVGELGLAWLERKRGHLKPSAYRSYENAWRVHVESRWRAAKVGEIRHTGVQAWVAELSSKGLSASRIITIYSVLAGILDDAMRDRMLAANPARGVNAVIPFRLLFLALAFTPIGTAPTTRHGPAALLPSVDLQLVGQVVHVVTATESSRRQ
jgi:hypothetical protein